MEKKWYIVHTFSGMEQKVVDALRERAKQTIIDGKSLEEHLGEILIPTEDDDSSAKTARKQAKKKIFPGYILVEINLTNDTWYLVKNTPNVTGFVGNAFKPKPLSEDEVNNIKKQISGISEKVPQKITFEDGTPVKVIDGPFLNFNGIVEEVKTDKQKLRVLVTIFGRATPVELNFNQVEKI
jgi:transcriptional antiterminator NusG